MWEALNLEKTLGNPGSFLWLDTTYLFSYDPQETWVKASE